MHPARAAYVAILGGAALWCAAIVIAPLLLGGPADLRGAGSFLYQLFRPVCHQIEGRSFDVLGVPLGVCSRCAGIYGAFLLGTLIYPAVRRLDVPALPSRGWLVVALAPMLFDVATGWLGLREVSNATRGVTGVLFGAILPFFIVPAAGEAATQLLHRPTSAITLPTNQGVTDA